jgi:surface antigen
MSKQDLGTGAGVIVGATVGQLFGNGAGRLLATVGGAIVGGFIGNRIGASLDEADRVAVSRQSADVLSGAKDGSSVSWASPSGKASAEIIASNTRAQTREIPVLRDKRVQKPAQLDLIGKTYETTAGVRLRAAPTTQSEVLGSLQKGESFNALGRIPGTDWIAVGKGRKTVGYISSAFTRESAVADATGTEKGLRPAMDLDQTVAAAKNEGFDLDAEGAVAETITVSTQCRTVDIKVTQKNGSSEQDKMNACRASDGAWEIL